MDVPLIFGLVAIIIILGFQGNYFSKKTGVPDILILLFFGFLVGPVLKVVQGPDLAPIAPVFAAIAITVILFDGGLHMDLYRVLEESPRAVMLTIFNFTSTLIITMIFTSYFLRWELLHGMLLGSIIGGTSSAIVLPLVKKINIPRRVGTLLSLESVFTDVLVIVFSVGIIQIWTNSSSDGVLTIVRGIFSGFSVGAMIGIAGGILWIKVMNSLVGEIYNDILTLGTALGIYAVSESLGGSGAISALLFGLVLGNSSTISRILRIQGSGQVDKIMRRFHGQISFLMRTFFYVYIGIIITFGNLNSILIGLELSMLLLAGRYLAVVGSSLKEPILQMDRKIMTVLMPRGLAAAVLSQLVVINGIPNANMFSEVTISIIISTVVISTIGGNLCKLKIPKLRATSKNEIQRMVSRMKNHLGDYPTVVQKEGETPQHLWFRQCVVKCMVDGEFREEWRRKPRRIKIFCGEGDVYRSDIFIELLGKKIAVVTEAPSQEGATSLHKVLKDIHSPVKKYEAAGFDGELRLILDDISALCYLRKLNALQKYYTHTQNQRRFSIDIQVLDLNSKKILPLEGLMKWVGKQKTQRSNPLVSLLKNFDTKGQDNTEVH